jgi:predicted dehydrogenase
MADKVRVGLIGTSWWTDMMYVPSLASHQRAETVAVCGRNPEPAKAVAAKLGGAKVFADYDEMIAAGGLDAVVIATPDDTHRAMVEAAARAGLHVLCEKPLANTLDDALAMERAVATAGVINMVLFTWRWQPHWRYLKRLIDDGYIGRPFRARFAFIEGIAMGPAYQWRFDGRRGSGVAGDLGSHMIDMAHWFLGDVATISADLKTFSDQSRKAEPPPLPVNDACLIALGMKDGAQVLIDSSAVTYLADRDVVIDVELAGDKGTIEARHVFGGREAGVTIRGARTGEPSFAPLAVPEEYLAGGVARDALLDPYAKQSAGARAFIDAILSGQPATPDFADGVKVQRVLDAAFRSDAEGRVVRLA